MKALNHLQQKYLLNAGSQINTLEATQICHYVVRSILIHQRARQCKILNTTALFNKSRRGLRKLQARSDMTSVLPPVCEEHPAQLVAYD